MKLTQNTLTLLQNFANIQPNVLLGQDSGKLKTIAEAKNIFATADITETFDDEVGIYDLTEFLSAITLIDDPDFEFDSKEFSMNVFVSDLFTLSQSFQVWFFSLQSCFGFQS